MAITARAQTGYAVHKDLRGAYLFLAAALTSVALPMWLDQHQAADFMFGKALLRPNAPFMPLLQVLATGLATAAVGALALAGVAGPSQLNQTTQRRLTLGLGTMAVLEFILLVVHRAAGTLTGRGFFVGVTLAGSMATLVGLHHVRSQPTVGAGLQLMPTVRGILMDVQRVFSARTVLGRLYGLVAMLLVADHVQCIFMPEFTLKNFIGAGYGRQDATFVLQALGAAFLALPPWTLALKDEAEASQLRSGKRSDLLILAALALAATGHFLALGPWHLSGHAGWGLPGLIVIWTITAASVLLGLAARSGALGGALGGLSTGKASGAAGESWAKTPASAQHEE